MKRYGWYLFWLAAALLLFFGNGQLWITDSVESNYALTAKEMLQRRLGIAADLRALLV